MIMTFPRLQAGTCNWKEKGTIHPIYSLSFITLIYVLSSF